MLHGSNISVSVWTTWRWVTDGIFISSWTIPLTAKQHQSTSKKRSNEFIWSTKRLVTLPSQREDFETVWIFSHSCSLSVLNLSRQSVMMSRHTQCLWSTSAPPGERVRERENSNKERALYLRCGLRCSGGIVCIELCMESHSALPPHFTLVLNWMLSMVRQTHLNL